MTDQQSREEHDRGNSHAGQGAVMLDLGDDVGAIVVEMPPGMEALEIEIRPAGQSHLAVFGTDGHDDEAAERTGSEARPHDHLHGHAHPAGDSVDDGHIHDGHVHPWPHVGVVARPAGGRLRPSAVFGEVLEGRYDLYVRPHGPVRLSVDVIGGHVTEAVWPV